MSGETADVTFFMAFLVDRRIELALGQAGMDFLGGFGLVGVTKDGAGLGVGGGRSRTEG